MDSFKEKEMEEGDLEERPRVDFINFLQAAFMCSDPESAKRLSSCQSFFALS